LIIETKFYHQSSINADFDMQKIKLALSDFPEIDDVPGAALGFDALHVKKVYNNKLFLEEIDREVDVEIQYFVISVGFVKTCFTVKANIEKIWHDEDTFKSFMLKERKFKEIQKV